MEGYPHTVLRATDTGFAEFRDKNQASCTVRRMTAGRSVESSRLRLFDTLERPTLASQKDSNLSPYHGDQTAPLMAAVYYGL